MENILKKVPFIEESTRHQILPVITCNIIFIENVVGDVFQSDLERDATLGHIDSCVYCQRRLVALQDRN